MAQMAPGKAPGVPHLCLEGLGWLFRHRSHPPGRIQPLSQRRSDRQMSWVSSQGPGTVSLPGLGSAGSEGARWLLTA